MIDIKEMQSEFESFMHSACGGRAIIGMFEVDANGDYVSPTIYATFYGWQAATAARDAEIAALKESGPLMERGTDDDGKPFMGTMHQVLQDYRSAADAEAREADRLNTQIVALKAEIGTERTTASPWKLMDSFPPVDLSVGLRKVILWDSRCKAHRIGHPLLENTSDCTHWMALPASPAIQQGGVV